MAKTPIVAIIRYCPTPKTYALLYGPVNSYNLPSAGWVIVLPPTIDSFNNLPNPFIFNPVMNNLPSIILLLLAFTLILFITSIFNYMWLSANPIYPMNIRTFPREATYLAGVFMNSRLVRVYTLSIGKAWMGAVNGLGHTTLPSTHHLPCVHILPLTCDYYPHLHAFIYTLTPHLTIVVELRD